MKQQDSKLAKVIIVVESSISSTGEILNLSFSASTSRRPKGPWLRPCFGDKTWLSSEELVKLTFDLDRMKSEAK